MDWARFNNKFNNITEQLTSFASNVLADEEEVPGVADVVSTDADFEELKRISAIQQDEISRLRKLNEELNRGKGPPPGPDIITQNDPNWKPDNGFQNDHNNQIITNLKKQINDLENEKKELCKNLELLDNDYQANTERVVQMRDQLLTDYKELEDKYFALKDNDHKNEKLLTGNQKLHSELNNLKNEFNLLNGNNENLKKIINDAQSAANNKSLESDAENQLIREKLEKAIAKNAEFEQKSVIDTENYRKLAMILEGYEQQVSSLKLELTRKDDDDFKELQRKFDDLVNEKEKVHRKYVNILTETLKKYMDCDRPSDFLSKSTYDQNECPQLSEFSNQVENILKILLDFKCKSNDLEKELYDVTEEKTVLLTEKNHEIEKLMQNSEILSQEVLTKTETIKEYEQECAELMKNNDILISELEAYKNTSSLQTISETNEDNLLLLENELENANRKIEDLEKGPKTSIQSNEELFQLKHDHQQLLINFDKLQVENQLLKTNSIKERNEFNSILEKMRSDLENNEYQYTELNVNAETLKDEIEIQKRNLNELSKRNQDLECKLGCLTTELNDVRGKLSIETDTRLRVENELENLNKNAKICETNLKLQCDKVNRELASMIEVNTNLELTLSQKQDDFNEMKIAFDQIKNDRNTTIDFNLDSANSNVDAKSIVTDKEIDDLLLPSSKNEGIDQFPIATTIINSLKLELVQLTEERDKLLNEHSNEISLLKQQQDELNRSKNELTNVVLVKHQENITYHQEIQRLASILKEEHEKNRSFELRLESLKNCDKLNDELKIAIEKSNEEMEKLQDQNNFLRKKCEVLANSLLEEQNTVQTVLADRSNDKEQEILMKKLERLQTHLIEVEEHYTQELLLAEEKNAELQTKVNEIEQREKNSSTMYTSVSIRANQQVESLQHQLQLITTQRDELRRKLSDMEDELNKQATALGNLQFVLEQFQKDRQGDVVKETDRIRKQINVEKKVQQDLRNEMTVLQTQLIESKQGLQAAARLSDQLEYSKRMVTTLKDEVSQVTEKLHKTEDELHNLSSQKDGKIDKSLVKNLIIGLITTNNNLNKDQMQILKIIATVLDFNQQDHDKIHKTQNGEGSSWLNALLAPSPDKGGGRTTNMQQNSLSSAFVQFLQDESKPRVMPSLLDDSALRTMNDNSATSSRQTSPIVLSEIVLPTFADFGPSRNSSSILKDVLKDNT